MSLHPRHIGIDGRELVGQPTGVGRYLARILEVWGADPAFPHRVTLFVPEAAATDLRQRQPRWDVVGVPGPSLPGSSVLGSSARSSSAGTSWEQLQLPRVAEAAGIDVLFAAGYTAPLRLRCPCVVAVYDVSFFAHPEWFSWREGFRRRWITRASAKRAASVVTISEFSADEIVRWLGISRAKIVLAPPGAPDRVASAPDGERSLSRTILFVGSLFNRRHIPELLRGVALTIARVPDARLILVGDNRTSPPIDPDGLARDLQIESRVSWRRYVTDAELDTLYASARVFAFLSEYEGFAMTPLEAIACGVPAVLLDTPVAREVYGAGARLVALDPRAIADVLSELLTSPDAHARLLAAGTERLAAFSWRRSADVIRAALEAAAPRQDRSS